MRPAAWTPFPLLDESDRCGSRLRSAAPHAMGVILLTVITVLLGFWLGKGVPRLVQRTGSLARRSRGIQLAYGSLLLFPWLVGIALVDGTDRVDNFSGTGGSHSRPASGTPTRSLTQGL